ncbi:hypothetical protein HY357_02830 [Candidatus Roizmanbacteria bacterium]|nr:hypothetical protein [Candidatus Roizmanbacteria bacterium]
MDNQELIEQLKQYLKQVESTSQELLIIRIKRTIENLEQNRYQEDEDLVTDLQALGFHDLAQQVRRGMYI